MHGSAEEMRRVERKVGHDVSTRGCLDSCCRSHAPAILRPRDGGSTVFRDQECLPYIMSSRFTFNWCSQCWLVVKAQMRCCSCALVPVRRGGQPSTSSATSGSAGW